MILPKEKQLMVNSYVAFLDILGFKTLIEESFKQDQEEEQLKDIYNSLYNAQSQLKADSYFYEAKPIINVFSDNIAIQIPIYETGEPEAHGIFNDLAKYQLSLALDGYFVRGGVSIGKHFQDEILIFGKAFLKAYLLESKEAIYPRILIDPKGIWGDYWHVGFYGIHRSSFSDSLIQDFDGKWFINYLNVYLFRSLNGEDYKKTEKILLLHKKHVETKLKLYSGIEKNYKKYCWVAKYHNQFSEFYGFSKDYLVSL